MCDEFTGGASGGVGRWGHWTEQSHSPSLLPSPHPRLHHPHIWQCGRTHHPVEAQIRPDSLECTDGSYGKSRMS